MIPLVIGDFSSFAVLVTVWLGFLFLSSLISALANLFWCRFGKGPLSDADRSAAPRGKELPLAYKLIGFFLNALSATAFCSLHPHSLECAARSESGCPHFQLPEDLRERLARLIHGLETEANLHWFGRWNARTVLVRVLSKYMYVTQRFRDNPSLDEFSLLPPIFVTGQPRSGTTALHRVLAEFEDSRPVLFHEHVRTAAKSWLDEWTCALSLWFWLTLVPEFDAIHFLRHDTAEECRWSLACNLKSHALFSLGTAYDYMEWLAEQDQLDSLRFYKRVLILLQQEDPSRRLVLKCPAHSSCLRDIRAVFPDSPIVITHRDPAQTVPSALTLWMSTSAAVTAKFEADKISKFTQSMMLRFANAIVDDVPTLDGPVVNVAYKSFVANPIGTAERIRQAIGLAAADDEELERVQKFIADNRQNKHGKNTYSLSMFGISERQLRADYARYQAQFSDLL